MTLLFKIIFIRSSSTGLTHRKLKDIAEHLAADDYDRLGFRLGFTRASLDKFERDNPDDTSGSMATMLISWKNDQSAPPGVVRKTLSDALRDIHKTDLADRIYEEGMTDQLIIVLTVSGQLPTRTIPHRIGIGPDE